MSGLISCGVNCSNAVESVQKTCALRAYLQTLGLGAPCTEDDHTADRWVQVYWGSDEPYLVGYRPIVWPGVLKELLCCASEGCNRPGAPPPPGSCFTMASAPTDGYCAGRTFVYRMCAMDQQHADSAANTATQVPCSLVNVSAHPAISSC
jgi:hypothetical protein